MLQDVTIFRCEHVGPLMGLDRTFLGKNCKTICGGCPLAPSKSAEVRRNNETMSSRRTCPSHSQSLSPITAYYDVDISWTPTTLSEGFPLTSIV